MGIADKRNFDQDTKSHYIVKCIYKYTNPHTLLYMRGISYLISMLDKGEYKQHKYYLILEDSMFGEDI